MLCVLLALQYNCKATMTYGNIKSLYGAYCPEEVACSKRDATYFLCGSDDCGDLEVTGKHADCAVASDPENCGELCKEPCKRADPAG